MNRRYAPKLRRAHPPKAIAAALSAIVLVALLFGMATAGRASATGTLCLNSAGQFAQCSGTVAPKAPVKAPVHHTKAPVHRTVVVPPKPAPSPILRPTAQLHSTGIRAVEPVTEIGVAILAALLLIGGVLVFLRYFTVDLLTIERRPRPGRRPY